MAYTGIDYIVMTYIVMVYIAMAYTVMARMGFKYLVIAYIVAAHIVMAHLVMADIVMAYIVVAVNQIRSASMPGTAAPPQRQEQGRNMSAHMPRHMSLTCVRPCLCACLHTFV